MLCILVKGGNLFIYHKSVLHFVILKNGRLITGDDVVVLPDQVTALHWAEYNFRVT
jgi:hypothetical protein